MPFRSPRRFAVKSGLKIFLTECSSFARWTLLFTALLAGFNVVAADFHFSQSEPSLLPHLEKFGRAFFWKKHVSTMTVFNIYLFIYFVACIRSLTWPTNLTIRPFYLTLYGGHLSGVLHHNNGRWNGRGGMSLTRDWLFSETFPLHPHHQRFLSKCGWRVARTAAHTSPPLGVSDVCFHERPWQLELAVNLQRYSTVEVKTDLSSDKMEKEDWYWSVAPPAGLVRVSGRGRGGGRVRASKIPPQSSNICWLKFQKHFYLLGNSYSLMSVNPRPHPTPHWCVKPLNGKNRSSWQLRWVWLSCCQNPGSFNENQFQPEQEVWGQENITVVTVQTISAFHWGK